MISFKNRHPLASKKSVKQDQLKIRVTEDIKQRLDAVATIRGEALAVIVREAIAEYLRQQDLKPQKRLNYDHRNTSPLGVNETTPDSNHPHPAEAARNVTRPPVHVEPAQHSAPPTAQ